MSEAIEVKRSSPITVPPRVKVENGGSVVTPDDFFTPKSQVEPPNTKQWSFSMEALTQLDPLGAARFLMRRIDAVLGLEIAIDLRDTYIANLLGEHFDVATSLTAILVLIVRTLAAHKYWLPEWDLEAYLLLKDEKVAVLDESHRKHLCPHGHWRRYLRLLHVVVYTYSKWDSFINLPPDTSTAELLKIVLQLPIVTLCLKEQPRYYWRFPLTGGMIKPLREDWFQKPYTTQDYRPHYFTLIPMYSRDDLLEQLVDADSEDIYPAEFTGSF